MGANFEIMLAKLVFKIGQHFRNPSLKGWYLFLKKSEAWSIEQLEDYQLQQLKDLLLAAYQYSDFYKHLFDEHGVAINKIQSLDAIKKLPVISKNDLLIHNNKIHTQINFDKSFKANTSGSSGASLKFKREESADSFNRASIFRGYSWYNVNPWERNGYFWGFNFNRLSKVKTYFLDCLQNRFRLFSFQQNELKVFTKKMKNTTYVHGYSSMIYGLAKFVNANNLQGFPKLKMIKGTSEKIYESYQLEVKQAFGLKMISEYGAAETGIIAFECKQGNMHINMEGVLVEEENNEIIVTNLQMRSFPIIRYRLGDYIKLASKEKKCTCGMQHPILEEVTGRVGVEVFGIKQLYPSLYFYYIFKNLAKNGLPLTYQVHQKIKGQLIFKIEQELTTNNLKMLQQEIEKYFKNDMIYTVEGLESEDSKNKKTQSFISNLS